MGDPPSRAAAVMMGEYERKLLLWLTWMNIFFFPISLWYWYGQFTHLSSKPPIPLMPEYQYMNGRKPQTSRPSDRSLSWHIFLHSNSNQRHSLQSFQRPPWNVNSRLRPFMY